MAAHTPVAPSVTNPLLPSAQRAVPIDALRSKQLCDSTKTGFQAPFAELLSADCACRCSFERSLFEAEHVAVFTEVALWMSSPLTLAAERSVPAVTNGAE